MCLPSAQVVIPGFWDQAPCWAPCSARSLLLPLPSGCAKKQIKIFKQKIKSIKAIHHINKLQKKKNHMILSIDVKIKIRKQIN